MGRRAQDKDSAQKIPRAEDFTREAVYRAVLKDTVQHPLTLMPAVASTLGGLYMGLFGAGPNSALLTFGGALVAAGAWVYNYFVRGEDLAEKRVAKLRKLRDRHRHDETLGLEVEWSKAGLAEGVQQARELREAYQKLEKFLAERLEATGGVRGNNSSGFNVQRLMILAEDTYREGVDILQAALATYKALGQIDHEKLRHELEAWQRELEEVKAAGADASRIQPLETRIQSHQRRLELFRERVESVDQLFAQSEALESALETTYLEAVNLGTSTDTLFVRGHSASELERAVNAARRVEDRLREMSQPNPEDEVYLAAGEVKD